MIFTKLIFYVIFGTIILPLFNNFNTVSWNTVTNLLDSNNITSINIYENDNLATIYYNYSKMINHQNPIDNDILYYNMTPTCTVDYKYGLAHVDTRFSKNTFFEEKVNDYIMMNNLTNVDMYYSKDFTSTLMSFIFNFLIVIVIGSLLSMSMKRLTGGITDNPAKVIKPIEIEECMDDVIGMNDVKTEIKQYIDYMKNRTKYLKMNVMIPRGLLFVGPPGCGKTFLAKAIASEANVSFMTVTGSDFHEMFVGVGASRMKSLFNTARKNSPCIIFIDEIDSIGGKRSNNVYNSEGNSVLNKLLTEMDGFEINENIMIIAATNRVDTLDSALLRSGRFDRKLIFDKPNIDERKRLFELYLKDKKKDKNIDLMKLARQTASLTGADIKTICNQAGIICIRMKKNVINYEHINNAIDEIMVGNIKKERLMSNEEKERVAYHEAGHCLLSSMLKDCDPPIKVSIIPRGGSALGYSMQQPTDKKLILEKELYGKIMVLFGGRIAEEIKYGSISTGAYDDFEKATELAKMIITKYCFGTFISLDLNENMNHMTHIGEKQKNEIYTKINRILKNLYKQAEKIILDNNIILESIASKLLDKEEIITEEIIELVGDKIDTISVKDL